MSTRDISRQAHLGRNINFASALWIRCRVLVFTQDHPPFVPMPGEGRPLKRHHRADQIIDGREDFDGSPAIFAQPKLMKNPPKASDQPFYIRVPL